VLNLMFENEVMGRIFGSKGLKVANRWGING
jgi:hypothetical protein